MYKFTSGCHSLTTQSSVGDSQGQESFLAPSADKLTHNYDKSGQTTIPPYQP